MATSKQSAVEAAAAELGENIPPTKATKPQRKPPIGMPKTHKIILEEDDNIPPTGLFVGVNGTGYLLTPGEVINVPEGVIDVLDHAVMSAPLTDPRTKRVIGSRERMRYPYRHVA